MLALALRRHLTVARPPAEACPCTLAPEDELYRTCTSGAVAVQYCIVVHFHSRENFIQLNFHGILRMFPELIKAVAVSTKSLGRTLKATFFC